MKKFCSIILGIIVGGAALLLMLSLDLLFSFSSRSTIYPVLGFCVPLIIGYVAYIISYKSNFDLWGWVADLINKKRRAKKQKQEVFFATQTPKEVTGSQAVYKSDEPKGNHKLNIEHFCSPSFPAIHNGLPLAYYYPNNQIVDLNVDLLKSIILTKDYTVDALPLDNGGCEVLYNGQRLGVIRKHGNMIADWISRKEPFICLVTSVADGMEAVGIGFYRDTESRLKLCKNDVARLTRNKSRDMQISVSCLSEGETLKIFPDYIDDENAIPVQSITGEEVGFLPKKFNQIHEDFGIRGVFVDHVDETIDDNEDYKYSVYVRVYWN